MSTRKKNITPIEDFERKISESLSELIEKLGGDVGAIEVAVLSLREYVKGMKVPREPGLKKVKKRHEKLVAEHDVLVKRAPGRKRQNIEAEEDLAKKYGLGSAGSVRATVSATKRHAKSLRPSDIFKEAVENLSEQKEAPNERKK